MTVIEGYDFTASNRAEAQARREEARLARVAKQRTLDAAISAFVASREPEHQADRDEAELRVFQAQQVAAYLRQFVAAIDAAFAPLAENGLADAPSAYDADVLVETLADRFSDDHLARVFAATVALGGEG